MTIRLYGFLFLIGVLMYLGIAVLESVPGYMDADYYYAMGLRIANSQGFSEPFIWNYLSDPQVLPHPAYTYWMPFVAVLASIGIKLTGMQNFWGARLVFILLAGSLVPMTAFMSYTFHRIRWAALLAAAFALFSGFYLAYLPTTESFAVYMLLGSLFFLLVFKMQQDYRDTINAIKIAEKSGFQNYNVSQFSTSPIWVYVLVGLSVGLMYLTRADGLIWFGIALIGITLQGYSSSKEIYGRGIHKQNLLLVGLPLVIFVICYLIVISPVLLRNINTFGSIFAPGSSRALWLIDYDELFAYPASQLTSERWLGAGIREIINSRSAALGTNLLNAIAVQGAIILVPFIFLGFWSRREDWRVRLGALSWLTTFLIMTLIFPFQGARGGFFHSGAALQPLLWSLVPVGLLAFINWAEKRRSWETQQALKVFSTGLIGLVIVVTVFAGYQRIIGGDHPRPAWGADELAYQEVGAYLDKNDSNRESIVMVNNPPGFYALTGYKSIVIPDGDLSVTFLVGKNYKAEYLILDKNHPKELVELYSSPGDVPGLNYLDSVANVHIFKFIK